MLLKIITLSFIYLTLKASFLKSKSYDKNTYISDINKNYIFTEHLHTIYGEKCNKCNRLIGEFNFKKFGKIKCPGYPRIIRLSKFWKNAWLLGGDEEDGKIYVRRSENEGKNWGNPILITLYDNYNYSNTDFFELPNHDIIISYRAIGNLSNPNPEIRHNRKLCSSISHDGGKTWNYLGVIVDNFELGQKLGKTKREIFRMCKKEKRIGFFEPFVEMINNQITVFYSDDFTPVLMKAISNRTRDNYKTQNIYTQIFDISSKKWSSERKIILDGTTKKSPTGSGLIKRISRDGMPVVNRMKNGIYVLVFEGTYRDIDYHYLTDSYLEEYHPFEILLSYSKNGINWSNPVEIYTPKNNRSKASAPFVVVTENNQLIISFQTDEESILDGYKGDYYSIMKVMISKPGIDIENINKNSFYALCNNNNSPIGGKGLWNSIILVNDILYTCSSDNNIQYSEIPIFEDPNKYKDQLRNEYDIKRGNITTYGNKIISTDKNTLVIHKKFDSSFNNNFYSYIIPNNSENCGLIFGINNTDNYFWKENNYMFLINKNGFFILSKVIKGKYKEIIRRKNEKFNKEYNKKNTYKMAIKFNPFKGQIIASANDIIIANIIDNSLNGANIGLISDENNTVFTQIIKE